MAKNGRRAHLKNAQIECVITEFSEFNPLLKKKSLRGHHTPGGQSDQQNPQEYPRSSKKANSYTDPTQYRGLQTD